jgi:hypothetical protein
MIEKIHIFLARLACSFAEDYCDLLITSQLLLVYLRLVTAAASIITSNNNCTDSNTGCQEDQQQYAHDTFLFAQSDLVVSHLEHLSPPTLSDFMKIDQRHLMAKQQRSLLPPGATREE